MANARELKNRIKSVGNTGKITRTMELVASAKMRKAQLAAEASRPYAEGLFALVAKLSAALGESDIRHPLMEHRDIKRVAILVVTSDRGLCGAFNSNLVRRATQRIKHHRAQGREVAVHALGKKASSTLRFLGYQPVANHQKLIDPARYERSQEIIKPLMEAFEAGEVDHVEIVYSRFESAARFGPDHLTLLPAGGQELSDAAPAGAGDVLFSPGPEELLGTVIPRTVSMAFFSALLQTGAGEHAARRVAMKNATDAAKDLKKLLNRSYNRARQGKTPQKTAEFVGAGGAMP
jgi:F-type H+-transporting ATPase subunit gamma